MSIAEVQPQPTEISTEIGKAAQTVAGPAFPYGRWILIGAALIAAAVGAYLYFRGPAKATWITAKLDRGDIESTVSTSGTLNAVITVQVGSQVSGNILALYADFNTKVKKGQLVAEIDPAPFKASVDQATASLNAAKAATGTAQATLDKSRSDVTSAIANTASQKANIAKAQSAFDLAKVLFDRRQTMFTDGIASREDVDNAKSVLDQARASLDAAIGVVSASEASLESARRQIEASQHQLEQANAVVQQGAASLSQAQLNLSHTRILAPVDGTVQSRSMDVGQTVAASFQAPIIFLIAQDLTKMQVDTNVDEADVGRIQLDQAATFTVDAWPGRVFQGQVSQIRKAPINVQNVITYDVVIQGTNEDLKLFPGMTANVTVSIAKAANALRLPKAALRFRPPQAAKPTGRQQSQTVSVLDPAGELRQVPVTAGIADSNYVEVTGGGLTEGQLVVTGAASQTGGATKTSSPQSPGRGGGRMGF